MVPLVHFFRKTHRPMKMPYLIYLMGAVYILSALPFCAVADESGGVESEVVLVNVLYRHGDRTPVHPYPTDPYSNISYWPTDWGQLTTVGMRRHFELGQWLRKRYGILLGDYSKTSIHVQSTDVDRTLMSAESNLAGLFPPRADRIFEQGLKWQPIPIHTVPEHLDHLLAMKKACPRYDAETANARNLPEIKALTQKYQGVFEYLSKYTGAPVTTIEKAEEIHSILYIESLYNFTLPEWTKQVFPEPLQTISQWSFALPAYTDELRRLKGGPLIGEWVSNFLKKINGTLEPNRKMFIYSAHDTTIANILNTLNMFDRHCPPYASVILAELHRKGSEYFVAIYYKNSTLPQLLTIPGCTSFCKLKTFVELVRPSIPENWEKECHYHTMFSSENLNDLSISALSLSGALSLVLLALFVVIFIQQRRLRSDPFRYQTVSTNADA